MAVAIVEVEAVKIVRVAPGKVPPGFGGACGLVGIGDQVFALAGYVTIEVSVGAISGCDV